MSVQNEEVMGKAYDARLMRRLLQLVRPYGWMAIVSILVLIAAQAFNVYRPIVVKDAIDEAIMHGDRGALNGYAVYFVILLVGEFLLQYSVIYLTQLMGQKIIFDIRQKLFHHLELLHLQFFDQNPVGRLITRVTSDIESLNDMFTSGLVYLFGDIFLLIGIIAMMFTLDFQLTLVTLAVLPLIFYISVVFKAKVRVAFREVRLKIASLNSYLQENITGVTTVQIFNRESKNFEKFDELNKTLTKSHLDSVFHYAWFYPAINVLSSVAIGLLLWYGSSEIQTSGVSLGTLIAFINYAQQFFRPIQDLSDKYNILQSAMASSERIFKLIDMPNQISNPDRPQPLGNVAGQLRFDHVFFSYSPQDVKTDEDFILKDIDFEVASGQSIALVGATGSGKSTIINLVSRFYEVTRGDVLLDGKSIRGVDQFELRRTMAVVLQDVFLFSGTIMDNIRLGREDITREQAIEAARNVGADVFIQRLPRGYDEPVQERGSTLSVGQRQLIALARAFAFDPKILILDEATSSIDTETERLIQDATRRLMEGRTSIIIAHRLSTIRHVDQIIVMHKGRIRERGGHDALLRQGGLYYRLYQLQYKDQENGNSKIREAASI